MRKLIELSLHFDTTAAFLREARNLRRGRILTTTAELHPQGTPVRLFLHVPIDGRTVQLVVEGKVVRSQNASDVGPTELEIQLLAFSLADQRGLLDDFTEHLAETQSPHS